MSDTGATPAQIDAAVRRRWPPWLTDARADTAHSVDLTRARFAHAAHFLIPTDHRLIGPDHLEAVTGVVAHYARQLDFPDDHAYPHWIEDVTSDLMRALGFGEPE
jgi:hypothetical protein